MDLREQASNLAVQERARLELFDFVFRFDAIPIRANTGIVTALASMNGQSLPLLAVSAKPVAATHKQTNGPSRTRGR